jgi:hypothetical protein
MKDDRLKPIDNRWHIETDGRLKEVIYATDAFKHILEEWEKWNIARGEMVCRRRTSRENKKGFVKHYLDNFEGLLRKDLEWFVKQLPKAQSRLAPLPGKSPSSIQSIELT